MPPFFVISEATYPIRRIFRSRCSLENPSSEDKFLRTISPSSKVTGLPPISINLVKTAFAIVDFPDPESPVKNIVKPRFDNGGNVLRSSSSTSGNENQSGKFNNSYRISKDDLVNFDFSQCSNFILIESDVENYDDPEIELRNITIHQYLSPSVRSFVSLSVHQSVNT